MRDGDIYLDELLAEVTAARDLLKESNRAHGAWPGSEVMEAHRRLDQVLKQVVFTRKDDDQKDG